MEKLNNSKKPVMQLPILTSRISGLALEPLAPAPYIVNIKSYEKSKPKKANNNKEKDIRPYIKNNNNSNSLCKGTESDKRTVQEVLLASGVYAMSNSQLATPYPIYTESDFDTDSYCSNNTKDFGDSFTSSNLSEIRLYNGLNSKSNNSKY